MPQASPLLENAKAIGFAACMVAMLCAIWLPAMQSTVTSAHLMTSRTAHPSHSLVSILFIGDSFTSANDMPAMLVHIASSDPSNGVTVQVESVTKDGGNLLSMWNEGVARFYLASRRWTYTVLQEQGTWPMTPDMLKAAYNGASKFTYEIKRLGAIPLLYETWPRQPGPRYRDPAAPFLKNPRYMKEMLYYHTVNLANRLNIGFVPAGAVWAKLLDNAPGYGLYQPDGVNPGVQGTYLVALLFYHTLVHQDVSHVSYVPAGMSAQEAANIRGFLATNSAAH